MYLSQCQTHILYSILVVPTPEVVVTTDPPNPGTLVEGTYIDLVCTVTINEAVDTDVNVSIEWSRNGGSALMNSSNEYSISPISLVSDQYISIIRIEELIMTSGNGDTYSCSVSIQPSSLSNYITGSNGDRDITLSVEGKYSVLIRYFAVAIYCATVLIIICLLYVKLYLIRLKKLH